MTKNSFIRLTPSGFGGIAVVAFWGEDAEEFVKRRFRPRGEYPRKGLVSVGRLMRDDELVDECVISTIGNNHFELCVHASLAVMRAIEELFAIDGFSEAKCIPAMYRDAALISIANTSYSAGILSSSTTQCWHKEFDEIERLITSSCIAELHARLDVLCQSASYSDLLIRPRRVALFGAPNAGKSTLFNALLGFNRVIATDEPGTTHDIIEEGIQINGFPLILLDAPGHGGQGELAQILDDNALSAVNNADLVLCIVDMTLPVPSNVVTHANTIFVGNKSDIASVPKGAEFDVIVSATTRDNIDALIVAINRRLGLDNAKSKLVPPVAFDAEMRNGLIDLTRAVSAGKLHLAHDIIIGMRRQCE